MYIPAESRSTEIEIKKSRFIATAQSVDSEAESKEIIRRTREEHPKANHVVWAYILGDENSQLQGMSDDGEPHGTAGKPVLSILQYSGLTNVLVTVVRYFGGTKLGTGGLVKAYTDSAKAVIDPMPRRRLVDELLLGLKFGYPYFDSIKKALLAVDAAIESEDFGTGIELICRVEEQYAENLKVELTDISHGSIVIEEETTET